jgi:polysaccharide export outer membrane protein
VIGPWFWDQAGVNSYRHVSQTKRIRLVVACVACAWLALRLPPAILAAQQTSANDSAPAAPALPPGYVIGPEDVLSISFWKDKDLTAEVVVRPDGKISLPLLNDVQAAGSTPDELRLKLVKLAAKYLAEPNASVVVKQVNSRKVFITGQIAKPGAYPLAGDMTVLQLLALVGGLAEYADSKNIVIVRKIDGREQRLKFNYKDVVKGKHSEQNILLKPDDTIIVP